MRPVLPALVALSALTAADRGTLPDPLRGTDGSVVASSAQWEATRRGEVLELFRIHVYGRTPIGRPPSLRCTVLATTPDALAGAATSKHIEVAFDGPGGAGVIRVTLFVPNRRSAPAPAFLLIDNRSRPPAESGPVAPSAFWPAAALIARGYAAAVFAVSDVDPDRDDGFRDGVHGIFGPPADRRGDDAWGTIAAWAWGASRVMDCLSGDPDIDARRVAVVGHSRAGKTALWAGAEDPRFALVVSNESGCGGAALARGKQGERIADITKRFPHWFCARYRAYAGREADLPVDQHQLLTLIAPRLLYVASASEDTWADPVSEFAACVHAAPVYALYGLSGVGATTLPAAEQPLHAGAIGHHLRTGKHDLTLYDWERFMDFADRHWKPRP